MDGSFSFSYRSFDTAAALPAEDAGLLKAAGDAIQLAYAPYSGFEVGAALLLANNVYIKGANQENAAYPAGICAERAALATASSLYPGIAVTAVAIAYRNVRQPEKNDLVLSPCGICRQSLLEIARMQGLDFRIIMSNPAGKVIVMDRVTDLLPFAFSGEHL